MTESDVSSELGDGDRSPPPYPRTRRPVMQSSTRWVFALTGLWVVVATLAVMLGSVAIDPGTVWGIIGAEIFGGQLPDTATGGQAAIVWELRVPRVLMASIVGAGLTVCGIAIQAIVRNVLADPYILGVSSGASVGAAVVLLYGSFASIGVWALTTGSFLGASTAMLLVFGLSFRNGTLAPLRLLLTGTAMAYALSSLTSFLTFIADPRAHRTVLYWLLGGFGRATWSLLWVPLVAVGIGILYLTVRARDLNALTLGDDAAAGLGVSVDRFRRELFFITALVIGAVVSVSGAIGFVGLIMPHVCRLLVGADHRRALAVGVPLGASFLVVADLAARVVIQPEEIPVGVVTALVGVPVFLMLARNRLDASTA